MATNPLHQAFACVLAMAESHVEDIESGLEEGLYDASENEDLHEKKMAIAAVQKFIAEMPAASAYAHVCTSIVGNMVAIYGQAVTKDEEIDGGDAVEHLVEWVTEAQEAMN